MSTELQATKADAWAALDVHLWDIEKVVPYEKNSRVHTPVQIDQIARSIQKWGFTIPLLVDENGGLIAGHARLAAAQSLQMGKVPVALAKGWTDEQKRAYVIADNQLSQNSSWDESLLMAELKSLSELNFGLDVLGFNEAELARLTDAGSALTENTQAWSGMPEFDQQNKKAYKTMALHFRNDADIAAFAQLIGQQVTPTTRFVWFPAEEIIHDDKRYVSES